MNEIVLKIENVSKTFNLGKNKIQPLTNIDLEVKKGEFVAIMGPSGSGKTTLLNLIGCIDKPTDGKIFIEGIDISVLSESKLCRVRRDKISFVFQSFNLLPYLNARENVEVAMELADKYSGQRKQKAKEFLALVGLSGREDHRSLRLSQGEQQRVAIARALSTDPVIMLADEPTGNLDGANKQEIIKLLSELNKKSGATILMVTHDEQVAACTQRILTLNQGKITQQQKHKPSTQ